MDSALTDGISPSETFAVKPSAPIRENRILSPESQATEQEVSTILDFFFPPKIAQYYKQYTPDLVERFNFNHKRYLGWLRPADRTIIDPVTIFRTSSPESEFKGYAYELIPGIPISFIDPTYAEKVEVPLEKGVSGFCSVWEMSSKVPDHIMIKGDETGQFEQGSTLNHEMQHLIFGVLKEKGLIPASSEKDSELRQLFDRFREEACAYLLTKNVRLIDKRSETIYNPDWQILQEFKNITDTYLLKLGIMQLIVSPEEYDRDDLFLSLISATSFAGIDAMVEQSLKNNKTLTPGQIHRLAHEWLFCINKERFQEVLADLQFNIQIEDPNDLLTDLDFNRLTTLEDLSENIRHTSTFLKRVYGLNIKPDIHEAIGIYYSWLPEETQQVLHGILHSNGIMVVPYATNKSEFMMRLVTPTNFLIDADTVATIIRSSQELNELWQVLKEDVKQECSKHENAASILADIAELLG